MLQKFPGYSQAAGFGLAVAMMLFPGRIVAQTVQSPRLELTSPFSGTPQSLEGSASGEFLVTTASSRILTLWSRSAQAEWQPRVIHAPPRDEYAGSYLGAISPDGNTIAFSVPPLSDGAGGYRWGTARIYMIERTSQQLIAVFSAGIPSRITRLRFSQDGNHLAAMLGQGCGVRLWTRRQWTNPEREQKPNYADDDGYGGTNGASVCCPGTDVSACEALPKSTDVLFTGVTDGSRPWMITLSENGLRTYIKPDQLPQRAGTDVPLGDRLKKAGRMALSPDGTTLAIGDVFQPQLAILTRDGLRFRWSDPRKIPDEMLNAKGKNEAFLSSPVWTQSGGRLLLYAFGYLPNSGFVGAPEDSNANRIAVFDLEARNVEFVSLGADSDSSLYASQIGQGAAPIFFVGSRALSAISVGASSPDIISRRIALDLRGNNNEEWVLRLNKERKQVYLSSPVGDTSSVAVTFDYDAVRIGDKRDFNRGEDLETDVKAHGAAQDYYDADTQPEWRFGYNISEKPVPAFFGTDINLEKLYRNEVSYSGAKLPDRNTAVWGTSHALRVIQSGRGIVCTRPLGSPAFRMNLSPDARMVVVGHGDGTIRWYRLGDPSEPCLPLVASLYLTRNDDGGLGFLAWLPNGKFMTGGGAALKNLACYPADSPDNFGPCIDYQETNGLFSPSEVKRALAEADSTEGKGTALATIVAKKQQEKPAVAPAVFLQSKLATGDRELEITLTPVGLGDRPRYLTLIAGAGSDLPFTIDRKEYSQAEPYPIDGSQTFTVTAKLPINVLRKGEPIGICPIVSSGLKADANNTLPLSKDLCRGVTWTGDSGPRSKVKLWALLIGFSLAPPDVPELQFAHEDAINFARFLQRDIAKRDLPGKSNFDDVDIRLLVAAEKLDAPTSDSNSRIKTILDELGGSRFHLLTPEDGNFVDTAKSAVSDIIEKIKDPRRTDRTDWQDQILVYFAGHGFSKFVDESSMRVGLVTPKSGPSLRTGVLWIDELVAGLNAPNLVSLIIIDACSAQTDKRNVALSDQIQLSLPNVIGTSLQFFLSSTLGHYSYEQQDYAVDDFVPGLTLWSNGEGTKGSGVFSMGLIASLLCQEAVYKDRYTFDSSSRFLNDRFFTSTNEKWEKTILPKLAVTMSGRFFVPDPIDFGVPRGGRVYSPILRSAATNAPQCKF
jgi:Caspase domain